MAVFVTAAFLAAPGCSESRPPLKVASPLTPAEEKRWNELWQQGSGPPDAEREAAAGRGE